MDIAAGLLVAAEDRSMSCTICNRPTMPGARLCVPCKAALKRARHETVSQLEPLSRLLYAARKRRAARRSAAQARSMASTAAADAAMRRRWILPAALVALGAVVWVGGYLGNQILNAGGSQNIEAMAGGPNSSPAPSAPAPKVGPAPGPTPSTPAPHEPASVDQTTSPADSLPDRASAKSPPRKATPNPGAIRDASPRPAAGLLVTTAESIAAFGPANDAADSLPPPVSAAPAATPREAPPPDRWQAMTDALALCARESFLSRVMCEQRARWQYCEGQWGRVPQCPGANTNEYGR